MSSKQAIVHWLIISVNKKNLVKQVFQDEASGDEKDM
jgi:hypothetical protein